MLINLWYSTSDPPTNMPGGAPRSTTGIPSQASHASQQPYRNTCLPLRILGVKCEYM
jgi:hypothetical protein